MRHAALIVALALSAGKASAAPCDAKASKPEPVRVQLRADVRFTGGRVFSLSVSPDGRYLAAYGYGHVAIWQADNLLPLWSVDTEPGALAWTADALLVTRLDASETSRIAIADGALTVEHVARVPLPDGRAVAIKAGALELRDASDKKQRDLAWPTTGRRLAGLATTASAIVGVEGSANPDNPARTEPGDTIVIWQLDGKGREVKLPAGDAHFAGSTGKTAVVLAGGVPYAIDTDTGAVKKIDISDVTTAAVIADRIAYLTNNGDAAVLDTTSGRTLWRQPSARVALASATAIAFDGAGNVVVAGVESPRRFDGATGHALDDTGAIPHFGQVAFADDDHLVTNNYQRITTWDLAKGRPDPARSRQVENAGFGVIKGDLVVARTGRRSPDRCWGPHYLDRWPKGAPPTDLDKAILGEVDDGVAPPAEPAYPPTGAATAPHCTVGRFDLARGRVLTKTGWLDLATKAEAKASVPREAQIVGSYALTVDDSNKLVAWTADGTRREVQLKLRDRDLLALDGPAFAVKGDTIAVAYGPHVFVVDGTTVRTIDTPAVATSVAFLADDLVVGLDNDTTRRYHDGKEIARITGWIAVVATSPSGKRLAVRDARGALAVWSADPLRPAVTLAESDDGAWLAMTPNGGFDGSDDAADLLSLAFASPAIATPMYAGFRRPDVVAKRLAGGDDDLPATAPRPPRVTIKVDKQHVSAHVDSATGGGELVAFVEGRDKAHASYCATASDLTFDLADAGKLTIEAFDTAGGTATATADLGGAPATAELWAVVVGIGTYAHLDAKWQLQADHDARALGHALEAMNDGKTFAKTHVTVLVDGQATRSAIDKALAGLAKMKPADQAIVFFAGHGWRGDDGKMVLVTSGVATKSEAARDGVSWDAIRDRLEAAPGRVLVLLDACHAGAFAQDLAVANEQLAGKLARRGKGGVVVFAAAKGRQYSFEVGASRGHFELAARPDYKPPPPVKDAHPEQDTPVGLFTTAVIAAFASPATDTNKDGVIQLSELVAAVTTRVEHDAAAIQQHQTPTVSRRELFGDFAVGPRL